MKGKLVENTKKTSPPHCLAVSAASWSVSLWYMGIPFARSYHHRWDGK